MGLFAAGTYGGGLNGVTVECEGAKWGVLGLLPIGAPAGTPWFFAGQFKAQLFYAFVDLLFVFSIEYAFFRVYDAVWGLRVSKEDELQGLDVPETGSPAYPEFSVRGNLTSYGYAEAPEPAPRPKLSLSEVPKPNPSSGSA